MKTAICAFVIGGAALVAGCGQKGALYLPDKNAAVVTRPAGSGTAAPQQPAPNTTTPPDLPTPDRGSSEQTPQNRAPEPPPSPTTQSTTSKPRQDKDKDESQSSSPPRSR